MRTTRRMLLGAAAGAILPSVGLAAPSSRRLSSRSARSVSQFLDSVAVGAHWTYTDTPYSQSYPRVRDMLAASGIGHVRAELHSDRLPDLASRGIMSTVNVGPENGSPSSIVRRIKELNRRRRTVVAVEGPNEPDVFWSRLDITYRGQGFPAGTTAFMRDLSAALQAEPATAGLPVIGPSLGRTYNPDAGRRNPFRARALAGVVDWGNFHPYPGGGNSFSFPFSYAGISAYHWHSDFPGVNLNDYPYAFDVYSPPFAPKPMACTETGYSTTAGGTSEEVQAVYVPRVFCEYFRQRVVRTYLYEFVDAFKDPSGNKRDAHFGLLRNDLSPKPAFTALQSLLAVLASANRRDGSGAVLPMDLQLSVEPSGAFTRTGYVHHLLLRTGDGKLCLLLWHEIAAQDISKRPYRRVRTPALRTEVTFSRPPRSARLYEYGAGWKLTGRNVVVRRNRLTLDAGERVSLLLLT